MTDQPSAAALSPNEVSDLRQRLEDGSIPEPNSGCWLWEGSLQGCGYANVSFRGRGRRGNRLAYWVYRGSYPGSLHVCHSCDVPSCVNPAHLFLGTRSINMQDSANKGRNGMQRLPHRSSLIGKKFPQNGERNGVAKLTVPIVLNIRAQAAAGMSYAAIGRLFNISGQHAQDIALRRKWAWLA
jgi:hypothetical protein